MNPIRTFSSGNRRALAAVLGTAAAAACFPSLAQSGMSTTESAAAQRRAAAAPTSSLKPAPLEPSRNAPLSSSMQQRAIIIVSGKDPAAAGLNPQPLPPRDKAGFAAPSGKDPSATSLNPQPLPPQGRTVTPRAAGAR